MSERTAMDVYDDGCAAESRMEECIYDFGVCGDWRFDPYDASVEMMGTKDGWLPSNEQRAAMLALGIQLAFVSYANGDAMFVNNATGASGPCSPRHCGENTSALVKSLKARLDAAEAAAGGSK